jgi:hypothetical protein
MNLPVTPSLLLSDVLLGKLEALDQSVEQAHGPLGTLDPNKERATPFRVLGERALRSESAPEVLAAFGEALVTIVESACVNFPGNLFWDHDYLAANLLVGAHESDAGPAVYLRETADTLASLYALYGRESAVAFRYLHDFLYGFDWARWVKREPAARAGQGPFDAAFLRYSRERGHELLHLIGQNDDKYPALPEGTARNPFGFSREPDEERVLHLDLARRGFIPVPAWDPRGTANWERPFAEIREARAEALRQTIRH